MFANRTCGLLGLVLVLVLLTGCGGSQAKDPVEVVQAFYDAASAEDVDAFIELLADDAEIEWGRDTLLTGKATIQRYAEAMFLGNDFTFEVSDFQVDGNRVSFNHKMFDDASQTLIEQCADEVIVEGGKIKSNRIVSCVNP
jgi:ketosteroid isomerase-like protein